jgi:hypothetical protein
MKIVLLGLPTVDARSSTNACCAPASAMHASGSSASTSNQKSTFGRSTDSVDVLLDFAVVIVVI